MRIVSTCVARLALAGAFALALHVSAWSQCGPPGTFTVLPPNPPTMWSAPFTTFCVPQTITVGDLTIGPGVTVLVGPGAAINVTGALNVMGTPMNPVVFTWCMNGSPWSGLVLTGQGSVVQNCIIQHANNSGLQLLDASATLMGCTIRNCSTTSSGGGLRVIQTAAAYTVLVQNCTLDSNTATSNGGGVDVSQTSGSITFDRCRITNNRTLSSNGGGVRLSTGSGQATFHASIIQGNTANANTTNANRVGGGLYVTTGGMGMVTMTNSAVVGNVARSRCQSSGQCVATGRGGGLYVDGSGSLTATYCEFRGNRAHAENGGFCASTAMSNAHGGGIYLHAGALTLKQCVVAGNSTLPINCTLQPRGAGIYCNGGSLMITHSTIANNGHSGQSSQGIYRAGGTVAVDHSIVWRNHPSSGSTASAQIAPPSSVAVSYSCVQGVLDPSWTNSINTDPQFRVFNGTTCSQLAINPTSPCVDLDPTTFDSCLGPTMLPGLGDMRADLGHFGGPLNCGWYAWTSPGASLGFNGPTLPPAPGQSVSFTVTVPPTEAGNLACVVISCSGTCPGVQIPDGRFIPVVPDFCTLLGRVPPLSLLLQATVDATGTATTPSFTWPMIPPGIPYWVTAGTVNPSGNVVSLTAPLRL